MSIDPAMTVAEIIKRNPDARTVLRRFGLDTCCGGSHPLDFACRAHNVELSTVIEALEGEGGGVR